MCVVCLCAGNIISMAVGGCVVAVATASNLNRPHFCVLFAIKIKAAHREEQKKKIKRRNAHKKGGKSFLSRIYRIIC